MPKTVRCDRVRCLSLLYVVASVKQKCYANRLTAVAVALSVVVAVAGAGGNELNNMKNALTLRYHHVYDAGTINQPTCKR